MNVETIGTVSPATKSDRQGFESLGGDDFLQLLVTQLTHQDPLEPTDNESLLQQLASIRDIQLSTTLTDTLTALTGSQRYGSAAALMGHYATGQVSNGADGVQRVSGIVVGVRFDGDGNILLELDSGTQLPLNSLESVTRPQRFAESLIGQLVSGVDRSDPEGLKRIEGVVTGARTDDGGEVVLELDTGESLPLTDLLMG